MHYIYFLPKSTNLYPESKPWGSPQRLGFENQAFAEMYVKELRKHQHSAYLIKDEKIKTNLTQAVILPTPANYPDTP